MDLNLARTFVAVAEAHSFSAAARALEVPTSSVSRAVGRLEVVLGTKLFERSTRRTALTVAGRAYLEHAARALSELTEGERRVGELLGDARGEVRLTVFPNFDDGFLARQLVAFTRAHPRVHINVVPTTRKVDLVAEGFDMALRAEQSPTDASLTMHELGRFHAWVVAARDYLKRRGRPKRPADLAQHDCVVFRPRSDGVVRWTLRGPRGVETVDVRGPIAADDMQLATQLVEAGAGIGTLVLAPGARAVLGPRLVRLLPEHVVQGPALFVVTPAGKRLLRVSLLRDFLRAAYAQVPSTLPKW
jgi:DNA-binding transcriptional LysR family regulator